MFDAKDLEQFKKKGTTAQKVESQLELIKKGFPYLELEAAASVGNGIIEVDESLCGNYIKTWDTYCSDSNHSITKFVPASGAASRMFKDLFAFLDANYDVPTTPFEKTFFDGISKFAFYNDLDAVCNANEGKSIKELTACGNYKAVVSNLLGAKGLNYGALPKGLLKFHSYGTSARTPFEEHMAESSMYASGDDGVVKIHFTVSPEHWPLFKKLADSCSNSFSKRFGTTYDISFSEQKPSTDTVAAAADGSAFRNDDGSILFRPGGHGALIENLNELNTDTGCLTGARLLPEFLDFLQVNFYTVGKRTLLIDMELASEVQDVLESSEPVGDTMLVVFAGSRCILPLSSRKFLAPSEVALLKNDFMILKEQYDYIFIRHTFPLRRSKLLLEEIASQCDAALYTVGAGKTPRQNLRELREVQLKVGIPIMTVLSDHSASRLNRDLELEAEL